MNLTLSRLVLLLNVLDDILLASLLHHLLLYRLDLGLQHVYFLSHIHLHKLNLVTHFIKQIPHRYVLIWNLLRLLLLIRRFQHKLH